MWLMVFIYVFMFVIYLMAVATIKQRELFLSWLVQPFLLGFALAASTPLLPPQEDMPTSAKIFYGVYLLAICINLAISTSCSIALSYRGSRPSVETQTITAEASSVDDTFQEDERGALARLYRDHQDSGHAGLVSSSEDAGPSLDLISPSQVRFNHLSQPSPQRWLVSAAY